MAADAGLSSRYPGTASTTGGQHPSGNNLAANRSTRPCICTAAARVGSAKYIPSTSPAAYIRANRHNAASVLPDPVSDSIMATGASNGVSQAACWIALGLAMDTLSDSPNANRLLKSGTPPPPPNAARCAPTSSPTLPMAYSACSRARPIYPSSGSPTKGNHSSLEPIQSARLHSPKK